MAKRAEDPPQSGILAHSLNMMVGGLIERDKMTTLIGDTALQTANDLKDHLDTTGATEIADEKAIFLAGRMSVAMEMAAQLRPDNDPIEAINSVVKAQAAEKDMEERRKAELSEDNHF